MDKRVSAFIPPIPNPLPKGWKRQNNPIMMQLGASTSDFCPVFRRGDGLIVLLTGGVELDGNRWIHLSMSFRDKLPSYFDMKDVKDIFLGQNSTAIQVFPSLQKHVNIHPNCLHLWVCLDKEIVPDFTRGMGTI